MTQEQFKVTQDSIGHTGNIFDLKSGFPVCDYFHLNLSTE